MGFGMVDLVKLVSLKHKVPFSLIVVFDRYTENPRNSAVKKFLSSVKKYKDCKITPKTKANRNLNVFNRIYIYAYITQRDDLANLFLRLELESYVVKSLYYKIYK